ncbi:MAG: CcmD family protein [Flavobacteriales bacterium]|jgi:hypothetical protein
MLALSESVFLGSGKAGVVLAVAGVVLIGLLAWMLWAERRLTRLERKINPPSNRP